MRRDVAIHFGGEIRRHGTFIACAELGYSCLCVNGLDRLPGARDFATTRGRPHGMWLGFSSNRLRNVAMLQDDSGTYHGESPPIAW